MNLRNVDLNLLVVLDALLTERNVSRAGERIGLTQSAMSAALARLRELFGDPLLVRVGRGLVLTRNAEELIIPVRETLDRIEQTLLQKRGFDPAADARTFSISASDYAGLVLLTPLVRALTTSCRTLSTASAWIASSTSPISTWSAWESSARFTSRWRASCWRRS